MEGNSQLSMDSFGPVNLVHLLYVHPPVLSDNINSTIKTPLTTPFVDPLTKEQKGSFIKQGYLVVKGAVPQEMVNDALKRINHAMGSSLYSTQVRIVNYYL